MATGTDAGGTWTTAATDKTVVATPALNDLIVVVHGMSGWASGDVSTITDDNADGLGTYTRLGSDTAPLSTGGGTACALWFSVRNALIGSATSTTFTEAASGETGSGLTVLRFSGMTRVGAAAIKQSIGESNQTENPPTITFGATSDTNNPIILAVMGEDNPPALTSPVGFTEAEDTGWATPTSGIQVCWDDAGNVLTLFAWTGGALADHNEIGVELDTSTAPVTYSLTAGVGGVSASTTSERTVRGVAATSVAVAAASSSLSAVRSLAASVAATTTATSGERTVRALGVVAAAGAAVTTLGYLYTVRAVASSGPVGGTSTATVSERTVRGLGVVNGTGVSTTAVTIVAVQGGGTQTLTASVTGISTTAASERTVYAVAAAVGATSTTAATWSVVRTLTAAVASTSAATASERSVRALAAAPAGQSTTAVTLEVEGVVTLSAAVAGTSGATVTLEPVLGATETPYASSYRHLMRAIRDRVGRAVAVTAFRLDTYARVRVRALGRAASGLPGLRSVARAPLATATVEATTNLAMTSAVRATVAVSGTVGGTLTVVSGALVGVTAVGARVRGPRARTAARSAASASATVTSRLALAGMRGATHVGPLYDEDEDELIIAMYAMLEAA